MENTPVSVSDAIALINQTLEYAYPVLVIEGEVSGYKVNKNRFVFFDLKDDEGSLGCFMTVYQLRTVLEEGMRVRVVAQPKITAWGKFSLTIRDIRPIGEGSIKRSFELLQAKLDKEGLFAEDRKRLLPVMPTKIGMVTSTEAAGYVDFVTILNNRWGGIDVQVANVQVQGVAASGQMIRALSYFNEQPEPVDVIVIVRGGGSADDLAAFNDEPLVRAIAASRIPTLVGVGHEVDVTLSDLAADVRAATPSNAAQIIVPDREDVLRTVSYTASRLMGAMEKRLTSLKEYVHESENQMLKHIEKQFEQDHRRASELGAVLKQLNPRTALKRGYALVFDADHHTFGSGAPKKDDIISIETMRYIVKAGVQNVSKK